MYKGVIRWHATCPKHTRFNPDKQGLGAIKGGCAECQKLVDIQRAVLTIRNLSKELGPGQNKLSQSQHTS